MSNAAKKKRAKLNLDLGIAPDADTWNCPPLPPDFVTWASETTDHKSQFDPNQDLRVLCSPWMLKSQKPILSPFPISQFLLVLVLFEPFVPSSSFFKWVEGKGQHGEGPSKPPQPSS